jgi:hypothetical protein
MTLRSQGDSTFFHASNFRQIGRFEITAYSHQDEQSWRPLWKRLNRRLVAVFGAPNVSDDFDELVDDKV